MRKQLVVASALLVSGAILHSRAALAEGLYGGVDLSYSATNVVAFDNPSAGEQGSDVSGFVGFGFGSGLFAEGELRFKDSSDDLLDPYDNLSSSTAGALRMGIQRGKMTGEFILGNAVEINDDGLSARSFAGLAGSYAMSDALTFTGSIGYLDGKNGTDDDGLDAIRAMSTVTLGAVYDINDRMSVWGNATYGQGGMDDDSPAELAVINEVSLGVDYGLGMAGLKAYGAVTYTDAYQGTEQDDAYETRLNLGLTYTFGDGGTRSSRVRPALPNYETWMGITGGVLE